MSAQALQRVLVRMLHDPEFVEHVHTESPAALSACGLDAEELAWLLRSDRRAYGVDPYRRARSLQGLVEEYPVSCSLALARGAGWEELDGFFSGERFHDGVQRGRSLALLFGGHLLELAARLAEREPRLESLVRLERGLARVRRRVSHSRGCESRWCLSPEVETMELPRGTLAAHQAVMECLGEQGRLDLERVLDSSRVRALSLPSTGGGSEYLLLARGAQDSARIEPLSPELFAILETARGGASREEMEGVCRALGAEEAQIQEILADFSASGELLPPPSTED